MYKVVKFFTDLQDRDHRYNVGDSYPRDGLEVSEARIAELAGSKNRQGVPLIEEVKVSKKETVADKNTEKPERIASQATTKPTPGRTSRKKKNER